MVPEWLCPSRAVWEGVFTKAASNRSLPRHWPGCHSSRGLGQCTLAGHIAANQGRQAWETLILQLKEGCGPAWPGAQGHTEHLEV